MNYPVNPNPVEKIATTSTGVVLGIRPDMNGDLPTGEKSYEWGYALPGDDFDVIGDWITREAAVESCTIELDDYEEDLKIGTTRSVLLAYCISRTFPKVEAIWNADLGRFVKVEG